MSSQKKVKIKQNKYFDNDKINYFEKRLIVKNMKTFKNFFGKKKEAENFWAE